MKKYILILAIILIAIIISLIVILNKQDEAPIISYEVVTNEVNISGTKDKKDRGYEIVEKDNNYYLIIYYGEQNSYYSSLEVIEISIKNEDIKVTVGLPKNEGMGDAFSYPKAIIKFDKEPNKIGVIYK